MLSRIGGTSYRYGFNGKETDNEVKGFQNQQDYGMRIYDPRIGRFLSVDPLTKNYPMLTPYQYASNSPIINIDLDGLEGKNANEQNANASVGVPVAGKATNELTKQLAKQGVENAVKHEARLAAGELAVYEGISAAQIAKAGGLTVVLTVWPKGGPEFPNNDEGYYNYPQDFWRMKYPNDPPRPFDVKPLVLYKPGSLYVPKDDPENPILIRDDVDDRPHEQYVLKARVKGKYPVMEWGKKDPVSYINLKKGDVWKYGTTVNPNSRYSQTWLIKMGLEKKTEAVGSKPFVMAREVIQIVSYFSIWKTSSWK
jgi:RHS repeat-associated protein